MGERRRRRLSSCGAAAVAFLSTAGSASAQPQTGPLTLGDAVQLALKNYPAVKERRARAQAADEGVGVARTACLPRLDMLWQVNRATTNNVFGSLLPQSTIFLGQRRPRFPRRRPDRGIQTEDANRVTRIA